MRTYLTLILLLCPTAALAQPVFFDDFDGNALLPHWSLPRPSDWAYDVSNSMLNVTGLFYPSNPKSPVNFASMAALYAPQGDFRMDGLMGWEAGQRPRRLGMEARFGPSGSSILASFLYADDPDFGPVPVIIAGSGAQIITMPAPPPGLYSFTIARVATHFEYYFDGNFVGSLPDPWRAPATGVLFDFVGPYPGLLGPLHIDRIQVVPTPATPLVILTIAMMCGTHRKRKSSAPASVIKAMQARAWVA